MLSTATYRETVVAVQPEHTRTRVYDAHRPSNRTVPHQAQAGLGSVRPTHCVQVEWPPANSPPTTRSQVQILKKL